jgi:soluble lytic murein transglycosylase-like protein
LFFNSLFKLSLKFIIKSVEPLPLINALLPKVSIDEIISSVSEKDSIAENFVKAVIKQESGFNPSATSKKGAMGLMQLMPKTAESLGVIDAYNPNQNIEGGVKYLKSLLDKYENNQELALAAYNAGPNAVKKYGGIPPYKETQKYVNAIMGNYNKVKEAGLL